MAYLSGVSGPLVREAAATERIGLLVTPANSLHRQIGSYRWWAADNGMFTEAVTESEFVCWLATLPTEGCLFVTAPDVVADWKASWKRSRPWLRVIRRMGFPAALVAQDGMTVSDLLRTEAEWDALFIGGSTEWKEGSMVLNLIAEAKRLGRHVHVGRVNSWRRLEHFAAAGADTVDGTYLAVAPDVNLPKLARWMRRLEEQPFLLEATDCARPACSNVRASDD
jgi:hypothetical protein